MRENKDILNIYSEDEIDYDSPDMVVASEPTKDEVDEFVDTIDFSLFTGKPFGKSFRAINSSMARKQNVRDHRVPLSHRRPIKPLDKEFTVEDKATIFGRAHKKIARVIVPVTRPLVVEGVSKFILSDDPDDNSIRNIGYWKGKKLNELVLTFNNDSALDFNFSLFNPSEFLDYLFATGQNLNDKIEVAGGAIAYSDVCYNILANPLMIRNCKFVISGPSQKAQQAIALQCQNKLTNGFVEVTPVNLSLQVDTMQVEGNTITFDLGRLLNRAFIPDGMDVINYTILAGNTVTMCFYYQQKSQKKIFYPEAREKKRRVV